MKPSQTALIIGAGPAGLTAAFELLTRTDIKPIIIEKSIYIGGISKTINYKGNRIDIGGHRFFSKSDRVMDWWLNMMPVEQSAEDDITINYQNKSRKITKGFASNDTDNIMLIRNRQSRIYYLKQFFTYPITISIDTFRKLGLRKTVKIGFSYTGSKLFPQKNEKTLEDFFINRFGKELYNTFFKDYTEKVWGVPCNKISSEWGAQRIKTLNIGSVIWHAIKKKLTTNKVKSISQKETETSLIEKFLYPKYGPGQLWEEVAKQVEMLGGKIILDCGVSEITHENGKVISVKSKNNKTNVETTHTGDYVFSTMPIQELINGMNPKAPEEVIMVANGLQYRDFITVGLLLTELKVKDETVANKLIKDNWIYIQEKDVKIGRLQIFNNWSPYMVNNSEHVWIGLEYFCNSGDSLWSKSNEEFIQFAIDELEQIGIIEQRNVIDSTMLKEEKTYPAYFGTYDRFDVIKNYTDSFANLFLIGRNGMHKYNNSDHSMLTAMTAVDNIISNTTNKENIWSINTEMEYHEKKQAE